MSDLDSDYYTPDGHEAERDSFVANVDKPGDHVSKLVEDVLDAEGRKTDSLLADTHLARQAGTNDPWGEELDARIAAENPKPAPERREPSEAEQIALAWARGLEGQEDAETFAFEVQDTLEQHGDDLANLPSHERLDLASRMTRANNALTAEDYQAAISNLADDPQALAYWLETLDEYSREELQEWGIAQAQQMQYDEDTRLEEAARAALEANPDVQSGPGRALLDAALQAGVEVTPENAGHVIGGISRAKGELDRASRVTKFYELFDEATGQGKSWEGWPGEPPAPPPQTVNPDLVKAVGPEPVSPAYAKAIREQALDRALGLETDLDGRPIDYDEYQGVIQRASVRADKERADDITKGRDR